MTLNDLYPGFKVTPFFDADLSQKPYEMQTLNGILIATYTRPTQQVISNYIE